jgi:type IV pilus assembly protein PilM
MCSRIKNVSLALPASAVITKKILLPAGLKEDDLEYQVESRPINIFRLL